MNISGWKHFTTHLELFIDFYKVSYIFDLGRSPDSLVYVTVWVVYWVFPCTGTLLMYWLCGIPEYV